MSLRVLIVDGHLAIGRGLRALLTAMPGLTVIGLTSRGESALAQAASAAPDVALVDTDLPGLCSQAVIRLLRSRLPRTRVVATGIYPERRLAALEAGAHAFVLKDAGYEALQRAITGAASANTGASGPDQADTGLVAAPADTLATPPIAAGAAATSSPIASIAPTVADHPRAPADVPEKRARS